MDKQSTEFELQEGHQSPPFAHGGEDSSNEGSDAPERRPVRPTKRKRTREPSIDPESKPLPWPAGSGPSDAHAVVDEAAVSGKATSLGYLVLHRVVCDGQKNTEEDHSEHQLTAYYDDEPRLFAKDDRASALRGRNDIRDLDGYLERQEAVAFVVYKIYSCRQYHNQIRTCFINVAPESINRASFLRLKPWFHTLPNDAEPAYPTSEEITLIQEGLAEAIEDLVSRDLTKLGSWNKETSFASALHLFPPLLPTTARAPSTCS